MIVSCCSCCLLLSLFGNVLNLYMRRCVPNTEALFHTPIGLYRWHVILDSCKAWFTWDVLERFPMKLVQIGKDRLCIATRSLDLYIDVHPILTGVQPSPLCGDLK